eukprot:763938-Hanusia_phi.AAC.1
MATKLVELSQDPTAPFHILQLAFDLLTLLHQQFQESPQKQQIDHLMAIICLNFISRFDCQHPAKTNNYTKSLYSISSSSPTTQLYISQASIVAEITANVRKLQNFPVNQFALLYTPVQLLLDAHQLNPQDPSDHPICMLAYDILTDWVFNICQQNSAAEDCIKGIFPALNTQIPIIGFESTPSIACQLTHQSDMIFKNIDALLNNFVVLSINFPVLLQLSVTTRYPDFIPSIQMIPPNTPLQRIIKTTLAYLKK